MRIAKNVFLWLAILFILANTLGYLGGASPLPKETVDTERKIGYFIGANLLYIIGFLFLFISYRIGIRIKKKNDAQLIDSLFDGDKLQNNK